MQATAVDTSVIVAGLLAWHQRHPEANAAIESALESGRMVLPAPALVEAFSVMTRLPAPHRLSPADAWLLLHDNFREHAELVALEAPAFWQALETWSGVGIAGGRVYDAHILACARQASATALLTFNTRDFNALDCDDIEIVEPSA